MVQCELGQTQFLLCLSCDGLSTHNQRWFFTSIIFMAIYTRPTVNDLNCTVTGVCCCVRLQCRIWWYSEPGGRATWSSTPLHQLFASKVKALLKQTLPTCTFQLSLSSVWIWRYLFEFTWLMCSYLVMTDLLSPTVFDLNTMSSVFLTLSKRWFWSHRWMNFSISEK